ncbi:MAG: tetratricopeptide repeat protein [bacterium]
MTKVNYYIDLALKTFQNIGGPMLNDEQRAHFIFALSDTYETLGNYEAALKNYTTALELSTASKDQAMQGQIQYRMARIYYETGDWQKAQDLFNESITRLQTVNNYSETALAQIELAKIAYRKGKYSQAMNTFQLALETAERVSDTRSKAIINNSLGIIRRMEGNYELAYELFQEALIEFQRIQDFRGTAESLNNLGMVHLWRQELQKAIEYFEKSLQICQEIGHFPLLAFVYLNKTEFYCMVADYSMAANMCSQALEYLVRLKNPIGIAKTNMLLGRIFWKSGDLQTAKDFYEESIGLYKQYGIPLGLANCYREFSQMLQESGSTEESAHFCARAQEIFNDLSIQMRVEKKQNNTKTIEEVKRRTQLESAAQVVSQRAEV